MLTLIPFFILFLDIAATLAASIRILKEYERGVVFRLGRCVGVRRPGLILLIPYIEQMTIVPFRTVANEIPAQDAVTKDNVTIKITAVGESMGAGLTFGHLHAGRISATLT